MNEDAIRSELAGLRETVHAGFARVDHYFELLQGHFVELRNTLIALSARVDRVEQRLSALEEKVGGLEEKVGGLEKKVGGLEKKVGGLQNEVRALRDWATRELADVRGELRRLRHAVEDEADSDLRRDVADLDARVTRLEGRLERKNLT
jgi:chromosome segregation ATPase